MSSLVSGVTGPRNDVLLGPSGFLNTVSWEINPEALTQGLGEHWEMLQIVSKRHSLLPN